MSLTKVTFSMIKDAYINAVDLGADPTGTVDSTQAIQAAIDAASASKKTLYFPSGTYKVIPATVKTWEGAGNYTVAFILKSSLSIVGDTDTIFKIADNVSTVSNPLPMAMFFTNEILYDVSFKNIVINMNGANNLFSPNAPASYNKYLQAGIMISGTVNSTNAARIDRLVIDSCIFQNCYGTNCIMLAQSNTPGAQVATDCQVLNCTFENVGYDTDDHSCISGPAIKARFINNRFINPSPHATTGGRVAIEICASDSVAIANTIQNFFQGFWVVGNYYEQLTKNVIVSNNTAKISGTFIDFWSNNLLPGPTYPYGVPSHVVISNNAIEISNDAVDIAVKSFLSVNARSQPQMISFDNNTCRSYSTAKDTVLATIVVGGEADNIQLSKADEIFITNNDCRGVTAGLICYFNGVVNTANGKNIGQVTYSDNHLGYLLPSSVGYPNSDIYLHGPKTGKVESLTVRGLQAPVNPIVTDNNPSGRATVTGQAILPSSVISWNGVTNPTVTTKCVLNTDCGVVNVNTKIQGGSAVTGGVVYPSFNGFIADSSNAAAVTHIKSGAAQCLPARVDNTGVGIQLFDPATGTAFTGYLIASSQVSVLAEVPTRSVDI